MKHLQNQKAEISAKGFTIIDDVFSEAEINQIIAVIDAIDTSKETFRKSEDLFAIRQFLKEVPESHPLIFNDNIRKIINEVFGTDYFVVKSIYFDKPEKSNWYESYHQDLTISVDKKLDLKGFGPWTT